MRMYCAPSSSYRAACIQRFGRETIDAYEAKTTQYVCYDVLGMVADCIVWLCDAIENWRNPPWATPEVRAKIRRHAARRAHFFRMGNPRDYG